ncbi:hypothetical protein KSP40_PGU022352 [Platanthera guangdongensis]|uniref:Uncharacterized protein n=1 Tax=Platanthera guangdongensis TaxID=2320717 RepID=A0ABR2LQ40_9ASPA
MRLRVVRRSWIFLLQLFWTTRLIRATQRERRGEMGLGLTLDHVACPKRGGSYIKAHMTGITHVEVASSATDTASVAPPKPTSTASSLHDFQLCSRRRCAELAYQYDSRGAPLLLVAGREPALRAGAKAALGKGSEDVVAIAHFAQCDVLISSGIVYIALENFTVFISMHSSFAMNHQVADDGLLSSSLFEEITNISAFNQARGMVRGGGASDFARHSREDAACEQRWEGFIAISP